MELHPKEIETVKNLEPFERYKYFIKRIADFEILYTLTYGNGAYATSKVDNHLLLPFWSAKEYADLCKIDGWKDCKVVELNFDDLENSIFDIIANENYLINVFPTNQKLGFVVDLDEFARDLSDKLKRY